MTAALFGWVADYGAALLFASALLSCLALPLPTSLLMLAAGAFSASGDMQLAATLLLPWLGAIVGDQIGFGASRLWAPQVQRWTQTLKRSRPLIEQALAWMERRGDMVVFLSRWLYSPLGPYVNVVAGLTNIGWARFTAWAVAGEAIWVLVHVLLGYAFGSRIEMVADLLQDAMGFVTAATVAAGAAALLWWSVRRSGRTGHDVTEN